MKRRKRISISITVAVLLFVGLSWSAYRVVRQANLNRQLLTVIKQNTFEHRRTEEVLACLKRGADPNARDEPYHATLSWNRLLVLFGWRKASTASSQPALLLALEGDVNNAPDCISHHTDSDIVKALLRYGADVKVKDKYGRTPLIAACDPIPHALGVGGAILTEPDPECELALVAAGSDVDARNENGATVLMGGDLLDEDGGVRVASALLRKGADVNAQTPEGATALICHAENGEERCCRLLLDHGADINHAEKDGSTALISAARSGKRGLVATLIARGANVNANVGHGQTALIAAASGLHISPGTTTAEDYCAIGRTLLQHGAVVDAQDKDGDTALIGAARGRNLALLKTLLQHGANVNAPDETGWTALTWAARWGDVACVQLLLERGASVTKKDHEGATLSRQIEGSAGVENRTIMRLLKAHGMKE